MRKLFSSVLSLLTSAAIALTASPIFASGASVNVSAGGISAPSVTANYEDDSYNYGYFLDENNVEVYKALIKLIKPDLSRVDVKLPKPVSIELSSYPDDFSDEDQEKFSNAIFENCKPAIDSAMWDIPELIWLDPAKMNIGIGDYDISKMNFFKGTYTMTITVLSFIPALCDGYDSVEAVEEYYDAAMAAADEIPIEGSTLYDRLLGIHDYIARKVTYDVDEIFRDSITGALVDERVVCEGYAKTFKLMCDRMNVPCVIVFGNFNSEEKTGHVWNYVKMDDGKWYAIDVTWDDLDGYGGAEVKHQYFLKGSKSFFTNHTEVQDYYITVFTYPELSKVDYDYRNATIITTTTTSSTTTETETTTSTTESETTTSTTSATTTTSKPTTSSTTTTSKTTSTTTTTSKTTTSTTTTTSKTTTSTTTTTSKTTTSTTTTTSKTTTSTTTTTSKTTTSTTTTTSKTTTSTTSTTSKTTTTETTTTCPAELEIIFGMDYAPDKLVYDIGGKFDITGAKFTASVKFKNRLGQITDYDTFTVKDEDIEVDTSGFDSSKTGTYTVRVKYTINGLKDKYLNEPITGSAVIELAVTVVDHKKYDLNRDGTVDAADLVLCAKAAIGSEKTAETCDVNGDGNVNVFDVIVMRQVILLLMDSK